MQIKSTQIPQIAVAIYFVTLLTLTMVTALAIGEVVLTTLMDIEFPNKFFPYKIPAKRITLSGEGAVKLSDSTELLIL